MFVDNKLLSIGVLCNQLNFEKVSKIYKFSGITYCLRKKK